MRRIGVVTVGRSDYGIYLPLLQGIQNHPTLQLQLYVTGMHLADAFGGTVRQIESDGFPVAAKVPTLEDSDTAEGVGLAIGRGVEGFARIFANDRPDWLVVLGDRFDMFAAALAAVPFNIPLLHIHGGELTEGAMDDRFRHSMTKMSHLHAVSTGIYAKRVQQMGEEAWRVRVTGALALDHIPTLPRLSRDELAQKFDLILNEPPILATLHPTTGEIDQTDSQIEAFLLALRRVDKPVVFTLPNADMSGRKIRAKLEAFCREAGPKKARMVENFGPSGYYSMLALSSVMVGNSSSGLLEAPSFALPVVNIGSRQQGRLRAANVIDSPFDAIRIESAIRRALSEEFRNSLRDLVNPHGDGRSAKRILEMLSETPLDKKLLGKHFLDLPVADIHP
jgi:UDP-hydrolysing UDP-N-acetyl-D-glucosamine 2-epimerase